MQLVNNLDIYGIPKFINESLFDILMKLSNLVYVNVKEQDVSKLYRSKTGNGLNSSIIVIFNNKNKKELIKAFKTQFKIKPIISTDLSSNFTATRIHLNEHLLMNNKN